MCLHRSGFFKKYISKPDVLASAPPAQPRNYADLTLLKGFVWTWLNWCQRRKLIPLIIKTVGTAIGREPHLPHTRCSPCPEDLLPTRKSQSREKTSGTSPIRLHGEVICLHYPRSLGFISDLWFCLFSSECFSGKSEAQRHRAGLMLRAV